MPQKRNSLRNKLPYQYAKLISRNTVNITASQVRRVFNGEITDPDKVTVIITEAKKLLKRIQLQRNHIQIKKRTITVIRLQ